MPRTSTGYSLQVGVKVDTTSLKTQLDRFGQSYTLNINVNANNAPLQALNTSLGNATTSAQALNTSVRQATQAVDNLSTKGVRGLQQMSQQSTKLSQTFGGLFVNQAKMQGMQLILQGIKGAFSGAIETVREYDDALTEMRKVTELSGNELDAYTQKLGEMGEEVARTRTEMVDASTVFQKAGYGADDAAQLARIASLYQNIADEELTASQAGEFIVAQLKAFNMTAEESEHIIDAVNEVSNNYAVSSADLADNIGKISATMSSAGNSYEQLLGMTTAITEQTRQASVSVRGL